jgi:hypothetical protein
MTGKILLSTAYLPPAEYFKLISQAEEAIIEREENYLKQSYRNRCYILSSHGPQPLTLPVYTGSVHKTPVKDIRIDYTKRWQNVHLGAITAAYGSSPYFLYYFENIEKIISKKINFLIDLNMELSEAILKMIKLDTKLIYTTDFVPVGQSDNDFRYKITPKKESHYSVKEYMQVFDCGNNFKQKLSILDLIFNTGPEAVKYL